MQKTLAIKLSMIIALCLVFLIGLVMIDGLVDERKNYEQEVIGEIHQTQLGTPILTTPFLVIDDNGKKTPIIAQKNHITGQMDIKNDEYARGIYRATSFASVLSIRQSYDKAAFANMQAATDKPNTQALPSQSTPSTPSPAQQQNRKAPYASLYIPISDLRGVILPKVNINGKSYDAKFAKVAMPTLDGYSSNFLEVLLETVPTDKLEVAFDLQVSGLSGFHVAPLGDTQVNLSGNWAEPKFFGDTLPSKKTLTATGFDAFWQNDFLGEQNSLNLKDNFRACTDCQKTALALISLEFVEMDNVYIKTERTLKYALILLVISFGAFFLFEVLKGLKIHPIQYLLVALALLVFYVLLLSLAEWMEFWQAYALATSACVLLLTWYSSFVLKSVSRSVGFGAVVLGLYAVFYVILSASDLNLLLGALFCFVILFAVMFLTRNIDWYAVGQNRPETLDDYQNSQNIHPSQN